jgi:hypothetical protein
VFFQSFLIFEPWFDHLAAFDSSEVFIVPEEKCVIEFHFFIRLEEFVALISGVR